MPLSEYIENLKYSCWNEGGYSIMKIKGIILQRREDKHERNADKV